MKNSKKVILGILSLASLASAAFAMEDVRGTKRNFDATRSTGGAVFLTNKKAKIDKNTVPEDVVFETADDKELIIPKKVALLSSTLREAMDLGVSDEAGVLRVHVTREHRDLTEANFMMLKKILKILYKNKTSQDFSFKDLTLFAHLGNKNDRNSKIIRRLITYFDIQEPVKKLLYQFYSHYFFMPVSQDQNGDYLNDTKNIVCMSTQKLAFYDYFKRMITAGSKFQESQTRIIKTELFSADLKLMMNLIDECQSAQMKLQSLQNYFSTYKADKEIIEQCRLAQNLIAQLVGKKIKEFFDEDNSITHLIVQCHQWELPLFQNQFIKYFLNESSVSGATLQELLHVLPHSFIGDFFSTETLDPHNFSLLFHVFLTSFLDAYKNDTRKEENSIAMLSLDNFKPTWFQAFDVYLLEHEDANFERDSLQLLNVILDNYDSIIEKISNANPLILHSFQDLLKRIATIKFKDRPILLPKGTTFIGFVSDSSCLFDFFEYQSPHSGNDFSYTSVYHKFIYDFAENTKINIEGDKNVQSISPSFTGDQFFVRKILNHLEVIDVSQEEFFVHEYPCEIGLEIKFVQKNYIVCQDRMTLEVIVYTPQYKKVAQIPMQGRIVKAIMLDEKTFVFILRSTDKLSLARYNVSNNRVIPLATLDYMTPNFALAPFDNEHCIIGNKEGGLILLNIKDGRSNVVQKESFDHFGHAHTRHIPIMSIFMSSDKRKFIVMKKGLYYNYELWDAVNLKRELIVNPEFSPEIIDFRGGFLISHYIQGIKIEFMPRLASVKEIVSYFNSIKFRF